MAVAAGLQSSIRQVVNSIDGLVAAIKSGAFVGILPDTILRSEETLRRCFDVPIPDIGAWIVFPERWRNDPDHALLREVLGEEMLALRACWAQHFRVRRPGRRFEDALSVPA